MLTGVKFFLNKIVAHVLFPICCFGGHTVLRLSKQNRYYVLLSPPEELKI